MAMSTFIIVVLRSIQQVSAISLLSKSNLLPPSNGCVQSNRRTFVQQCSIVTSLITAITPLTSIAASSTNVLVDTSIHKANDEEYASTAQQLYNPDRSLRENVSSEVKELQVSISWNIDYDNGRVVMDSGTPGAVNMGKQVAKKLSSGIIPMQYKLPEKWNSYTDGLYIDTSEGMNLPAAEHIYVYQAPGIVSSKDLTNAGTLGIVNDLRAITALQRMYKADVLGGRTRREESAQQLYYEFDLTVAPKTWNINNNNNNNNLGDLDFVPLIQSISHQPWLLKRMDNCMYYVLNAMHLIGNVPVQN